MPNLKVKPLEWYMKEHESVLSSDFGRVPPDFPLVGQDGFYCQGDDVWFEYEGRGYFAYQANGRQNFCYDLTVNDEAILPAREEAAMREVLKTTRDADVKRVIRKRLRLHSQAKSLRDTSRQSSLRWAKIRS